MRYARGGQVRGPDGAMRHDQSSPPRAQHISCHGGDPGNHKGCPYSSYHFASTSSTVVFSVAELGPTMMSKRPGSTTRFMSRFQNHSLSGVMANVTVRASPGRKLTRWKPRSSLTGRVTELT